MTDDDALSYCARQVREGDSDRFLAALFAPADRRESLFALYAFNLDVARIAEAVREPMMGQIRLQWWRERIAEIYDAAPPRGAEVAQALRRAIHAHGLPRAPFEALLEAREQDLVPDAPPTIAEFETYAEATGGALARLALRILAGEDEGLQQAGRHVGTASAMIGHLRAVGFHARRGKIFLPRDHLSEQGEEALRAGRTSPTLAETARRIAARAGAHLRMARRLAPRLPKSARAALLGARLAEADLRRLEQVGYDLFDPRLKIAKPRRQMILAWAAWRGRI